MCLIANSEEIHDFKQKIRVARTAFEISMRKVNLVSRYNSKILKKTAADSNFGSTFSLWFRFLRGRAQLKPKHYASILHIACVLSTVHQKGIHKKHENSLTTSKGRLQNLIEK